MSRSTKGILDRDAGKKPWDVWALVTESKIPAKLPAKPTGEALPSKRQRSKGRRGTCIARAPATPVCKRLIFAHFRDFACPCFVTVAVAFATNAKARLPVARR